MTSSLRILAAFVLLTWLQVAVVCASDQQIVYIRNTCECWSTDLKCVCKIESDPTSVRPLMQRLVNRTAEYYWQEVEFQSMVYDRTTFILANTFADGPFPSGITFKGDFSIVNDSFNHLNMTLNKVELNFETFSGRKPKFSKQYWRYIFDHGEGTLRTLRIIKYQIEDFIIPNYLGAALTQEVRPLTEFKVTGCEVKEVKERAFKNFTQLEVIDLSDNHLTTLPENVFSRNINLQKILLANNQISFLTKTIFDGLPNLLLINLRKNKLTAVPAIPRHTNRRFQPMVYLMADNSIHCRCSLIWVLHELTFHHNLEIEATCSDPTMVRGMPIIEGFTRMDKEACYRIRNIDDEALNLSGASQDPLKLAGPSSADTQTSIQNQGASAVSPSETAAAAAAAAAAASALEAKKSSGGGGGGVSALDELVKARADEEHKVAEDKKPVAAATAVAVESALGSLIARSQSESSNYQQPAVAVAPPVAAAAAAPPAVNQIETQAQAVAPQAPVSGPDAALPAQSSPKQALDSLASSSPSSQSSSVQLVDVAQQTVLTPSQAAIVSPVAAVAPAEPTVVVVSSASSLSPSAVAVAVAPQQQQQQLIQSPSSQVELQQDQSVSHHQVQVQQSVVPQTINSNSKQQ